MNKDTARGRSGSTSQDEENTQWAESFLGSSTVLTSNFRGTPTAISPDVGGTPSALSPHVGGTPAPFSPAFSLDPDEILNSFGFPFDVDEGSKAVGNLQS